MKPLPPIFQFFDYSYPTDSISWQFCALARKIATTLPDNEERAVALRKLLEAKDAAVRAVLAKE